QGFQEELSNFMRRYNSHVESTLAVALPVALLILAVIFVRAGSKVRLVRAQETSSGTKPVFVEVRSCVNVAGILPITVATALLGLIRYAGYALRLGDEINTVGSSEFARLAALVPSVLILPPLYSLATFDASAAAETIRSHGFEIEGVAPEET